MNASQSPAVPPSQPAVVQQTTVVQVGSGKSVGLAILLAVLFGPLGMLYATVPGAIVMFLLSLLIVVPTVGVGLVFTWLVGIVWAGIAANSHNRGLTVAAQSVATHTHSPAAWHPDPDGSGRLRYWDGWRWTDHYADDTRSRSAEESTQLQVSAEARPADAVACESCGEQVVADNRFCPSCGAARPATA